MPKGKNQSSRFAWEGQENSNIYKYVRVFALSEINYDSKEHYFKSQF